MVFRFSIWLLLCGLPGLHCLEAQTLPYRRIAVTHVGETELSSIADIVEDEHGFLWLGGLYSLYKYDGTSVKIFSNRPDAPTSIVPGAYVQLKKSRLRDALWIGSNTGGVSLLDLQTEQARNYPADPDNPGALAGNEVGGLWEDANGGLWVGTTQMTLHYLPPASPQNPNPVFQRFRPPLPADSETDVALAGPLGEIVPDPRDQHVLWIGSRYGIYRFDIATHTFRLFVFDKNVVFWYRPINLQLCADPDGYLWCGSFATGLCRLDPHTGQWAVFKKDKVLKPLSNSNTIQDIIPLDQQQLLILTASDDMWTVDWKQQQLTFLDAGPKQTGTGASLAQYCVRKTRGGDLWLAYQGGLHRMTQRSTGWGFVYFPRLDPTLNRHNWQRSYALSPDKQSLFIGTLRGNGLLEYHLGTRQIKIFPYRQQDATTDVLMSALCFDTSGRCWIGSDTGLLYLDRSTGSIRRFDVAAAGAAALDKAHISALALRGNTLWLGTKGKGLYRWHDQTRQIVPEPVEGLPAESAINCLLVEPSGRIWIGYERGLLAYDPATKRSWRFNRRRGPPEGLSNDMVTALALDGAGHLWVSTLGGGILRLRQADPEHPRFDAFFNNEVPGANVVYQFVLCDRGQVWLGLQSGLAVLDTATRTFVNYDSRDGMFAKIGAMIRMPDGRIASGAHMGFHFFHPDSVLQAGVTPRPYLKQFQVFDKETNLPAQIDRVEELSLAHNQNHFSFELGAINFGERERTRFAYRLKGYDRDWVFSGARNYISYTNLPTGAYVLQVKAANKHGTWSTEIKTIRILIRPPYWQTWWFRLCLLALFGGLVYGLLQAWQHRQRTLQAQAALEYFARTEYQHASVREILWDVSHKCIARLGLEDCVIYLLDEQGEFLIQEAAYGSKSPDIYELKDPLRIPLGQGIVGAAGLKGQVICVPDTRLDRRYIVDDQPRLSELAVPIIHDGQVIGVIDSEHTRRGFFTEHHSNVLKTIASLCADKIAQARARELVQEKERQLRELNQNLAESQLTALRAQMNPHFLFNCLNSINWYIIKNRPAEASRYIAKFSRLIRLILEHSKSRQITLSQELDALRLYLEMESMRFEHRFVYQIDLAPELDPEEVLVPPLIFQPYVENALWHGLMPKNTAGHIRLSLELAGEALRCTIEDDGIGRAAAAAMSSPGLKKRQSKGLEITEARIRQARKIMLDNSPIQIIDLLDAGGQACGTRVVLTIG